MDLETASKIMSNGYYVSRSKWKDSKLIYIADGHLCEMFSGPIKKLDFRKAKITFEDFSANDWFAVKVKRNGKNLTITNGYHRYDLCRFTRLMAKVSPLATKEVLMTK